MEGRYKTKFGWREMNAKRERKMFWSAILTVIVVCLFIGAGIAADYLMSTDPYQEMIMKLNSSNSFR